MMGEQDQQVGIGGPKPAKFEAPWAFALWALDKIGQALVVLAFILWVNAVVYTLVASVSESVDNHWLAYVPAIVGAVVIALVLRIRVWRSEGRFVVRVRHAANDDPEGGFIAAINLPGGAKILRCRGEDISQAIGDVVQAWSMHAGTSIRVDLGLLLHGIRFDTVDADTDRKDKGGYLRIDEEPPAKAMPDGFGQPKAGGGDGQPDDRPGLPPARAKIQRKAAGVSAGEREIA